MQPDQQTQIPGAAGDATPGHIIAAIPPTPSAGDADAQIADAIAHDRHCTLTIGEAQQVFLTHKRQPLAARTLQRYCQNGAIQAQLISHSQGKEWLINEASLVEFILKRPFTLTSPVPGAPSVETEPTPADPSAASAVTPPPAPPAGADTPAASAVKGPTTLVEPEVDEVFAAPHEVGERRRLSDVLIENARLTATLEGRDAVIAELKDDQKFLREEVRENRTLRDYMKQISDKMLDTFKTVAIEGNRRRDEPRPRPIDAIDDQP